MLPGGPYEGIPRGRSQNLPTSVLGPVGVSTSQGGLMSAAPGSSVMGPGPPGAPGISSTITATPIPGQVSSNTLKNGTLSGMEEEVRTLFVSGLPMDVRLRELYLLFRCYEGYEGSFLKLISSKPGKPPQPIAFVSFKLRKQAERALSELQGVRFDPASSQTLRLEFARTNSRVSPKQQQQPQQQSMQPQQHLQQQQQQQQQQSHHQQSYHHHMNQQQQSLMQQQQQVAAAGQHHQQQHHLGQHQQQLSPHALHNSHSPHQHMAAAMAMGQSSANPGYVGTYSAPSKSNSSCNLSTLHSHHHPNAMAQGLYNVPDTWPRMMSYNALSHVSTPSPPTLSPAPSTPHLSVLNILSDTDSSAAPSPTPDHAASVTLPGSLSSSTSSLTNVSNSIAIAPQSGTTSDLVSSSGSPTSTLVVTNIDQSYSEDDVCKIFKDSSGFLQTKVQYNGGQMFGLVDFKDADSASEALERFQDMSLSSSSSNRSAGLIICFAQAPNPEHLDDGSLGTPPNGGVVAPPTTLTVIPPTSIAPIGTASLGAIGTSTGSVALGNSAVGSGIGPGSNASSMPIPQQVSIPVQYQNGHMDPATVSAIDLSQQMSELDLSMQNCPSPVLAVGGNPSTSPGGLSHRQSYVEYPPHLGGGFGGQGFPNHQLMFSDSYPQGAVFLNNFSNPMMGSWQFPNVNQSIK